MNLRGQPTAGPAQRMIGRLLLTVWPVIARWFQLPVTIPAGAGRVLMRPSDRGIHTDIPGDQPGRVRPGLQPGHHPPPHTAPLPAAEQAVHRLPGPVTRWHVPPRRPDPHPPPDPVNELPLTPFRRPAWLAPTRQQRLQLRPLPVGQVEPPRHRYAGHEVSGVKVFLVEEPSTGDLAVYRSTTRRNFLTQPAYETRPSLDLSCRG
jgi:hypothetical protein